MATTMSGERPRAGRRGVAAALWGMVAALPLLALAPDAAAQAWPSKPVTLVVGTPPGGAIDAYARALADQLAKDTGGTFLVDYKAGANGNIAAEYVKNAAPDGHTLWMGTAAMVTISPSAYPVLRWKQTDFRPIAKGIEAPLVLVAHPSVPARNFPELVRWIGANPGKVSYASFSPGTPSHFLPHQLKERLSLDIVHVPYKGSGPQVVDLLAGQVPLGFTQIQSALPHLQSGKLNAFAVTSAQRSRFLPQVPTLAELGYPDLTTTIWFGVLSPAVTPLAVVDQMIKATVKVQANPEYRARLEGQGFDVPTESGDAFAASIEKETARWAQVIRATGFRAND